ncbi:HEPN domain-containing protein [Rhodococcus sp. NPDC019627]|uniref:ApeA N-terminal domain 1-containing protein n=1 Tax=unclassified Rhodococcus (in: high G+C Gram-positive bacteria) TaxID=192944 RepID=UPI0033C4BFE2
MAEDFRDLTERVGFLHNAETHEQIGAGRLDLSARAITFEMPVDEDVTTKLGLSRFPKSDEELSERFVFRDRHGKVGLGRCHLRSSTSNWGGGLPGWVRLDAQYAVEIGALDQDYWAVNGLRTEIAGLAAWTGLSSVTTKTETGEHGLIKGVTQNAVSGEPIEIGTPYGLSMYPYFSSKESRANGRYTLTEKTFVQTKTEDAIPWEEHVPAHQSVQDLIVLAYWSPCGLQVASVGNDRYPLTFPGSDQRIADKWREVIATWGGRGNWETPMELPTDKSVLFHMGDLGVHNVRRWIEESEDWLRIVGPLTSSQFQKNPPIEAKFMQIAVAIEGLGYRIGKEQGLINDRKTSLDFPKYLKLIHESLDCSVETVLEGSPGNGISAFADFSSWAEAFNKTYKEAKHADHPLPDYVRAWVLAESGALLVRLWLARHFGVERERLEQNAKYLR